MPNTEPAPDLREVLRRAIELAQPNLRKYVRMPRKGRIVKAYKVEGTYYADVQPLTNDGSPDPDEPMYPKLDLPVIWGGSDRGVVCPPRAGTPCVVGYYDGDPNFPFIQDIRWSEPPETELEEFVIHLDKKVELRIDKNRNVNIKVNVRPEETKKGKKRENCLLIEVGDDKDDGEGLPAKIVFRAPEIHTYTDNTVSGSFDACPRELRASTRPE